ncbi:sensor histidine kinase [Adhaeribacter pallidiroseus]|uniref:histidine kinase n=1 Tax=Adhaeribacter pallidiroseus TaxID=2072847 RepID=A0A369QGN1_9BACT|nr:HAMP domain-containing sensor histidine kinase [Adhaeribacter pallidiroseus]RDC63884.1 Histidine kinase [Adhaeribacter pallidiroseus]
MKQLFNLVDTSTFMPHGHCYQWNKAILWPTVVGDALTGIAYFSIPFMLFYLAQKRKYLVQKHVFILFGMFILACGTTHLLDIWTVWDPVYDIASLVKVVTGLLSLGTAFILLRSLPKILLIPSADTLAMANSELLLQMKERHKAEAALRQANDELENRVNQRTAQLIRVNRELEKEVEFRKKVEKNLIVKNGELIRINADLDNFVYCASHDLKSPVINAEGLITVLKEELPGVDPDISQVFGKLEYSIHQMHRTINDLTQVSKIQKDTEEEHEFISFATILDEVTASLAEVIQQSGAVVHTDFTANPKVWFSRKNLKSVLYNLVSNAIKYRSPDRLPVVSVTSAAVNNYVVVTVTDNGIGIDLPKHEKKIFSLFKRLRDDVEGSGVGLFIVKRIMDFNQGKIEVGSTPGEGSTFRAYFPNKS